MVDMSTNRVTTIKVANVVRRARDMGLTRDPLSLSMDLSAVHMNGCPLDFDRLLSFDGGSFGHDVCGIAAHIDRGTGKLGDFFSPRCAVR